MKPIKKRVLAFLFLILIGIPPLISISLSVHSLWIRHEMLEQLEKQQLHILTLSTDEIDWYVEGKELLINGELFDVKKQTSTNDIHTFWGLFDREETALFSWVDQYHEKDNEATLLSKISALFIQFNFTPPNQEIAIFKYLPQWSSFINKVDSLPESPFINKILPPPNWFLA